MVEKKDILVVDDDPNVQELIKLYMERENYTIVVSETGEEALEIVSRLQPLAMILDIMLPGMDGWKVLEKLRIQGHTLPVLMLSGRGQEYDKVRGLELGADDYLTKPFSPLELMARIKAVLRRVQPQKEDELQLPGLIINFSRHTVKVGEEDVSLTPKEFALLSHLARHRGRVFSREILLQEVWNYEYLGDLRTVDVHIKSLRKKIHREQIPFSIETVWGIGYKFQLHT